ncbi:MAG: HAMP domain-containing protein [Spirochaetaceae bacterium]|nr:HAMP domain-containing protein [Spirochaetaceae bacterium]
MRFRRRLALALGVVAAASVLAGWLNVSSISGFATAMDALAGRQLAAHAASTSAKDHLHGVLSGVLRAFVREEVGRSASILAEVDALAAAFYDDLAELRRDNPARADEVDALREDFQRYYLFAASAVGAGPGALREPGVLERFGRLESGLSAKLDALALANDRDFSAGFAEVRAEAAAARNAAIGLAAMSAAFALGSALILGRSLSRPLQALSSAAAAFGGGDFGARTGYRSRDEFGRLAETFDAMADGIADLNAGLEGKVRERTRELGRANESLDGALAELRETQSRVILAEKMAALGRLAAGVAHEVNTPLAAILSSSEELERLLWDPGLPLARGYAELGPSGRALFEGLARDFSEAFRAESFAESRESRAGRRKAAELLAAAGLADAQGLAEELSELRAAHRAGELLPVLATEEGRRALGAAHAWGQAARGAWVIGAAAGKAAESVQALRFYADFEDSERPSPFDLSLQLEGVLALYRDAERRGIRLTRKVESGARAFGRADEIGRVWINLIDNAAQALESGGEISVSAAREGDRVLVAVADTGKGIPEEHRGRIFEPFFTTKPRGAGRGLGLCVAKRIVESNGGDIRFRTGPGGTVFEVSLPAAAPL